MKIVFDNIIFSLQKSGGISVVWKELISRFLKYGQDNLHFIEHKTDKENIFRQMLDLSNCVISVVKPWYFKLERYINPKIKYNEPFIFHSSYFRTCDNKCAINVTTVHDFTYEHFYKNKRRGAFLHIWQRNRAIKKSNAIICISENTKKDLLKFLPTTEIKKIHVIYNGVSDDYYVTDVKKPELNNTILFVGARSAYKNAKWFVDVISKTDYRVLFCGRPLNAEEKKYYDNKLGDNYQVVTNVSNNELNIIYNSVKCLVYPSLYEGFGIPVIEAQKAGCPVIAYNCSSIPEIIGDTTLLMNNLTDNELLSKLEMLNDDLLRISIIDKGLKNSMNYSWDNTFSKYRALYDKLLKDKMNNQ